MFYLKTSFKVNPADLFVFRFLE